MIKIKKNVARLFRAVVLFPEPRTLNTEHHVVMAFCALLALLAGVPHAAGATTGALRGVLAPASNVTAVAAIARANDAVWPGVYDAASGRFEIAGLPLGTNLDLRVTYAAGARLEGVNLRTTLSKDAALEDDDPLPETELDDVCNRIRRMIVFEDIVGIVTATGTSRHVCAMVERIRSSPFYASKPDELIWRLEVWRFEKPEETETWTRAGDAEGVLYRVRMSRVELHAMRLTFDPRLGGLCPTAAATVCELGTVRLPEASPGVWLRLDGRLIRATDDRAPGTPTSARSEAIASPDGMGTNAVENTAGERR